MANQEDSEIDIQIISLVSHLRELHEKLEEKILKLMKEMDKMTDVERETLKALLEMLMKRRDEARETLEDHAAFLDSRNRDISPETKTSRLNILKECEEKIKNLDLGNQEIQSRDTFGVQEQGGSSNSSGRVSGSESKKKDPIFSLSDSDTSKEEETEVLNEANVDPDMKRRFLNKMKGSFSSSDEMESGIDESSDVFDDRIQDSSTSARELQKQGNLLIGGTSEEASNDEQFFSNIDGLVEDLKKQGGSSNSSEHVSGGESKQKDPIFSLSDSDTSKEEETEVLKETNIDPDMKRRFLGKMRGSFSSSDEMESETEESSDTFDDQDSSSKARELQEQRDLMIAGTSEGAGSDEQTVSNIDGLVEDLKRLGLE